MEQLPNQELDKMKKYTEPIIFYGDTVELRMSRADFKLDIEYLRRTRHMTQKSLGDAVGLSSQCISNIEALNGNPTLSSIEKYLDFFDCELVIRPRQR